MQANVMTIKDWFSVIEKSDIKLPRFQRGAAWKPKQIEGVLENILRKDELPIGALLVLEIGNKEPFISRPISGAPSDPKKIPRLNLLDGQQRMTALWRSLKDDYEHDNFKLFVLLENENEDQPEVVTVKRSDAADGQRLPVWADNPKEIFRRKRFPVSILCPGEEGELRLMTWTKEAGVDQDTYMRIANMRSHLINYPIPYLLLPENTEADKVLDVYIMMNTSGTPLKSFDIVVAQVEASAEASLHDMIAELKAKVPEALDYGNVEDISLAIGALLCGKEPGKKTYLEPTFGGQLDSNWDKVVDCYKKGLTILREEAIFNKKLLPTDVVIYVVSALCNYLPKDADKRGRARKLIRKMIWRANFTDHYLTAPPARAFRDYKAILEMITDPNSSTEPVLFNEDNNPLPEVDDLWKGGWPNKKDKLGRAIMAVSLYAGGYDFAIEQRATAENVQSREFHHLYPKKHLIELSEKKPESKKFLHEEIDSALNCALISWEVNRKISADPPKKYLKDRAKEAGVKDAEVKKRLKSHLIPYDELVEGDFGKFLKARAELLYPKIKKLCDGENPFMGKI